MFLNKYSTFYINSVQYISFHYIMCKKAAYQLYKEVLSHLTHCTMKDKT